MSSLLSTLASTSGNMGNHKQVELRQIAGLSGIVPAWWISTAGSEVSGADAWTCLKNEIEAPGKRTGDLRWFPFANGELYGIQPQKVWEEMGRPDHPTAFVAACIFSPGPAEASYRFDTLSNYRLWVNGKKAADRWEDDLPTLDKGEISVRLVEGLNGVILEMPSLIFKDKLVLCGRISTPEDGEMDGIKSLAPVGESDATGDGGDPAFNFSPFETFNRLAAKEPLMRFKGDGPEDFEAWKAQFKAKVLELVGDFPEPVPLDPQVVERTSSDGITREKVVIQTHEGVHLPLYLLVPEENRDGQAIVALHGHGGRGGYGKEQVAGVIGDDSVLQRQIRRLDYNYGLRFAQEGYITITPDFRSFGERTEALPRSNYDPCDVNFFRYACYDRENFIRYQIWDGMRAIDYLMSREEVNPDRVGLTGLSYGGRMTMYIGALDKRMKVCVASGAMNFLKERKTIGIICGSQTLPGLLTYGDTREIFGLIAPRPLLMQLGTNDATSPVLYAPEIDGDLGRIYRSAGDESRYDLDVFHSKHRYNFETALRWFRRWL